MKIKEVFNKDKLYFTSDPHFYHENIIKYCNRPFKDRYEMNDVLINNWNKVVPKDGIVFVLGDVALTSTPKALSELLHSLNGEIYLIKGNHEKDALGKEHVRNIFKDIFDVCEIEVEDDEISYGKQHIFMSHYPHIVWNASHRGSWHLFGHVHGGLSNKGQIKHPVTALDVGVDCHNYSPISYQQVKELITKQCLK